MADRTQNPPALVKAQTSTTGTGTYTVAEPGSAGYRTFTRAVTDGDLASGDTVPYAVIDTTVTNGPKLVEIGIGVWDNTAKTLTRATVYQPNGTAIDWGVGTRDVIVIDNPVAFLLLAGGTMTGILKILLSGSVIGLAAETGLLVQRSASAATESGMSIVAGNTGKSKLNLGDTDDEDVGGWYYNHSTNELVSRTAGSDRVKVNSSGVLVNSSSVPYENFATGSKMIVPQSTAYAGWTKDTANNDKALRIVSGASGGSAGGSLALSSASVGGYTLTVADLPQHSHIIVTQSSAVSHQHSNAANITGEAGAGLVGSVNTEPEGGGVSHTHSLALAYLDVIAQTKN